MYIKVKIAGHEATKNLYDLLLYNVVHTIECSDFLKEPFRAIFGFKVCEKCYMSLFFCKNADFNADFESVEK
jgi:hypothetical protein